MLNCKQTRNFKHIERALCWIAMCTQYVFHTVLVDCPLSCYNNGRITDEIFNSIRQNKQYLKKKKKQISFHAIVNGVRGSKT
jgi:hypothetical protein